MLSLEDAPAELDATSDSDDEATTADELSTTADEEPAAEDAVDVDAARDEDAVSDDAWPVDELPAPLEEDVDDDELLSPPVVTQPTAPADKSNRLHSGFRVIGGILL